MLYANNKGADQTAHPRSQISTFIVRCLNSIIPTVVMYKISRIQLTSVAEQAGFESYLVTNLQRQVFSWPGAFVRLHNLPFIRSISSISVFWSNRIVWPWGIWTNIPSPGGSSPPHVQRELHWSTYQRSKFCQSRQNDDKIITTPLIIALLLHSNGLVSAPRIILHPITCMP